MLATSTFVGVAHYMVPDEPHAVEVGFCMSRPYSRTLQYKLFVKFSVIDCCSSEEESSRGSSGDRIASWHRKGSSHPRGKATWKR